MNMFGKPLSDYVRFSRLFLVLIAVTGLVRLALSLGAVPNSTVKWFSMTGLMWIAVVYYAIRVHKTGFGTYKHLLPVLAVLNVVFQAIAIAGILIAILTGNANVFSAPEYAFCGDGNTWSHPHAQVFIGNTLRTGLTWAIGCTSLAPTSYSSA